MTDETLASNFEDIFGPLINYLIGRKKAVATDKLLTTFELLLDKMNWVPGNVSETIYGVNKYGPPAFSTVKMARRGTRAWLAYQKHGTIYSPCCVLHGASCGFSAISLGLRASARFAPTPDLQFLLFMAAQGTGSIADVLEDRGVEFF